jgi:hypothetical protein
VRKNLSEDNSSTGKQHMLKAQAGSTINPGDKIFSAKLLGPVLTFFLEFKRKLGCIFGI